MELYLQFGHGMMEHCRHLIKQWEGGTVILSPRDIKEDRIEKFANEIHALHQGRVLFDPQFYLPRCDHEHLCAYSYWPGVYSTGAFWSGPSMRRLIIDLFELNSRMSTDAIILPGLLANQVDSDWLAIQSRILETSRASGVQLPLYPTIALSDIAVSQESQIARLLEEAEKWNAPGYYLVCQHPSGEYLVNNPMWVANVLDLVSGLRLNGAKVILGYCSHQMLIASTAKADAICSGTFMNVRSFPPEKFKMGGEDMKQRSVWYYCSQTMSEYKDSFLDIAHRLGVLHYLHPDDNQGGYANRLFSGSQPTTVGFQEQEAFRHYLDTLHRQVAAAPITSFDDAIQGYDRQLDRAEELLVKLHEAGIRGQQRDFRDIIDVQRAALAAHVASRGPILRRGWNKL